REVGWRRAVSGGRESVAGAVAWRGIASRRDQRLRLAGDESHAAAAGAVVDARLGRADAELADDSRIARCARQCRDADGRMGSRGMGHDARARGVRLMLLALSVVSEQGATLGNTAYKIFDERGGSIGRVAGNDWVLPDPQNFVSSRHARVSA